MTERSDLVLADGQTLQRGQTLRSLPGKRDVFTAQWHDRAVVVKRYLDPRRGAVHSRREVEGLQAFATAGIAAPAMLMHGVDGGHRPVVILQRIEPAESLDAAWDAADAARRSQLLHAMMSVLAAHHRAGIRQTDLHPGNFLLAGDRIYSLDGAGVVTQPGELDQRASLDNLALFFAQFRPDSDPAGIDAVATYADARGWSSQAMRSQLPALIAAARERRWQHLRPKLYRECTAIVHDVVNGHEVYAQRSWGEDLLALAADPDASLPDDPAQWLKDGNTATVWRTSVAGRGVVVKRYNTKNPLHGLRQAAKESRASISWRNAHMLTLFGVPTPDPLALVYGPRRGLRRASYFIAREQAGIALSDWVRQRRDDRAAVDTIAQRVGQLFALLYERRISHGDMKATNFIVDDGEVFVIDLDAMRRHRTPRAFARAWRRDMQRFAANWESHDRLSQAMRDAIVSIG